MQVLSELTIPFLKIGGKLIALKAQAADQELEEAKNALCLLLVKSLKTIATNCQMEILASSPLLKRKRKHLTSIQEKLACLTKNLYK